MSLDDIISAGPARCPGCGTTVGMFVKVLFRDRFGTPTTADIRTGKCNGCNAALKAALIQSPLTGQSKVIASERGKGAE